MKKKSILFLHGDIFDLNTTKDKINYFKNFFKLNESTINNFTWNESNPDYLFVSEHLYYGKNSVKVKQKFLELQKTNPITIFVSGECIEPDFNLFDYAIVFDRNLEYSDRVIRIPFFAKFSKSIFEVENTIKTKNEAKKELNRKNRFCNFIYSNGNAHYMRDTIFHEINKYKKVDSLGNHLRNVEKFDPEVIKIKDWRLQSIKYKEPYKFSIASENASYPGYISEKIMTSFQAHTIPIYFGDPEIAKEFNGKAFINYHNYQSLEKMVDEIKKIDSNDDLWIKMISEPWITKDQIKIHKTIEKKYYDFFNRLINSDKKELYRKSEGFHPQNYRNNFENDIIDLKRENEELRNTINSIINSKGYKLLGKLRKLKIRCKIKKDS